MLNSRGGKSCFPFFPTPRPRELRSKILGFFSRCFFFRKKKRVFVFFHKEVAGGFFSIC